MMTGLNTRTIRSFGCHRGVSLVAAWAFLFISAFGLPGCSDNAKVQKATRPVARRGPVSDSEKVKELQKRLDALLQPVNYRYSPSGKPDPFRPFVRSTSAPVANLAKERVTASPQCMTPLECMDVGQLTLVGVVIKHGDGSYALAQDASGIGYILTIGTRIGFHQGKVTNIQADRVIVTERTEDIRGRTSSRNRVLLLHPEEEE